MFFKQTAQYLQKLESITSRLEITATLASLFKEADPNEIGKICYLLLGRLAPVYEPVEFNLAEKTMMKAIAQATQTGEEKVKEQFAKTGDLGAVVENLKEKTKESRLSVTEVFNKLYEITESSGQGSVERKITLCANLLKEVDKISAKFIVKIALGKLRLGFSDVTLLDSLSWMETGGKSLRPEIEKAYNVSSDIGKIASIFKKDGLKGLKKVDAEVGVPIRTAAAERLPSAASIIDKLGVCAAEPKYDGFRMQIHKGVKKKRLQPKDTLFKEEENTDVEIYSRNLENITAMFPDVVAEVGKLRVKSAIFEGEAVGYNPVTGEFLPFQETAQRKRKYDIEAMAKKLPLKVFCFDLLLENNKSLITEPYTKRRERLQSMIKKGNQKTLLIAEEKMFLQAKELESFFTENIEKGLEGIMCKKPDAPYQAGARNFNWVKFKREEKGELEDTIDCAVMGYYTGEGKRADFGIGAFLVGVYDEENDIFKTIAKIGSGLTDEEWREMKKQCDKEKVTTKPARYEVKKELEPPVWVLPKIIVVIRADEITRSQMHTAEHLALRFPRLVGMRDDKSPEDATTVKEIITMYKLQKKASVR